MRQALFPDSDSPCTTWSMSASRPTVNGWGSMTPLTFPGNLVTFSPTTSPRVVFEAGVMNVWTIMSDVTMPTSLPPLVTGMWLIFLSSIIRLAWATPTP